MTYSKSSVLLLIAGLIFGSPLTIKKVFLIVFNKDIGSSQKTAVSRGKGGRGGLETFGEKRKIVVK